MALSPRACFVNFGDAVERRRFEPGIVQRLAERTGVTTCADLDPPAERLEGRGVRRGQAGDHPARLRPGGMAHRGPSRPRPARISYLPDCGVIKFTGQTPSWREPGHSGRQSRAQRRPSQPHRHWLRLSCTSTARACCATPAAARYSKDYFRQPRYENIFCNSFGHNVPRIGGQLQAPGPEFGGRSSITARSSRTEIGRMEVGHHRFPQRLRPRS